MKHFQQCHQHCIQGQQLLQLEEKQTSVDNLLEQKIEGDLHRDIGIFIFCALAMLVALTALIALVALAMLVALVALAILAILAMLV